MLRKRRTIQLIIEKKVLWRTRKKTIKITYGGATLYQYLQLQQATTDQEKTAFFLEWRKNNASKKLSGEDEKAVIANLDKIWGQIIETAFHTERKNSGGSSEFSPYASYLVFLVQELRIEPRKLMEYTLQEIEYLSEGILWNLNAKSEEGQKQNRLRGQQLQAGEKLEKEKSKIDAFLREGKVLQTREK